MKITLKPLGAVADEVVDELKDSIKLVFGCPVVIKSGLSQLSDAMTRKEGNIMPQS